MRYMTLAHRRDNIEAVLVKIAEDKLPVMVTWLDGRHKAMTKLSGM